MGGHDAGDKALGEPGRRFLKRLLDDLYALEKMLEDGQVDAGPPRIGAEQELFLVDAAGRPAPVALDVLERAGDPHLTTELALFNLEVNLDPAPLAGDGLARLEAQLDGLLARVQEAAGAAGADVVLTGILPTLRKSDMGPENMTPLPRYAALDRATRELRGEPMQYRIKGIDELSLLHDSVMLESCNASFQVHLQVAPDDFSRLYNAAQALAGPVLAAAAGSPLLFGHRLWQETRIALFQQAVDYRSRDRDLRRSPARVSFGEDWVRGTASELFKRDITRHRVLVSGDLDEDPFARLAAGEIPALEALRLHNSTVWHWNRACYGINDGRPTLRIENRLLPSGPTVRDEMASAALWLGLMAWVRADGLEVADRLPFADAKENFLSAARNGLCAQFRWLDQRTVPAQDLLRDELIPRARDGLAGAGVDAGVAGGLLDVVAERVAAGRTGARWLLTSLAGMAEAGTASERMSALVRGLVRRRREGAPVHTWRPAELGEAGGWKRHYVRVEQFMTTNLFTVHAEDPVDLAVNMMHWESIRHVPVEDDRHRLVGLLSYRTLLRHLARDRDGLDTRATPVSAVMRADPITVSPDTDTVEAIELMRANGIGCLPVVREGRLVGILTERDFMVITRELLCDKLRD